MYKKLNLPHIHIILVTSGLGNQMFCYAYYQALKKTYSNSIFLLDSDSHIYGHYGLEIFNVLHCRGEWRWYLYRLIKKIYPRFFSKFTTIKQINALAYEPLDPTLMENNTYHIGFHQSEKYFLQHSNTIRKHFKFKSSKLNKQSQKLAEEIASCNSVSIHIRRGDYLTQFADNMCTYDYYIKAIRHIERKVDNPQYYFFSDDIKWCINNFGKCNNHHYVNVNSGKDSWQDMYLMTKCKHNIIANSSFSWWGAWLNNNTSKIVIAPNPWFRTWDKDSSFDVIPDNWVKIDNY